MLTFGWSIFVPYTIDDRTFCVGFVKGGHREQQGVGTVLVAVALG